MIEWRDVNGWEDQYLISDTGIVRRKVLTYRNRFNPIVLIKNSKNGYLHVWLGGAAGKNHYVHRLVAFAFLGSPPSDRHEVAHWDGNRANNRLENLRWATKSENSLDMRRHGTTRKLDADDVAAIRKLIPFSTRAHIAEKFGVTPSMVSKIALGQLWQ